MLSYFKSAYGGAGLSQLHLGVLPGRCIQRRPGRHGGLDAQLLCKGLGVVLPSGRPHHECESQGPTTPVREFGSCTLPWARPWRTWTASAAHPQPKEVWWQGALQFPVCQGGWWDGAKATSAIYNGVRTARQIWWRQEQKRAFSLPFCSLGLRN